MKTRPILFLTIAAGLTASITFAQTEDSQSMGSELSTTPETRREAPLVPLPDSSPVQGLLRDGPPLLHRRGDEFSATKLPAEREDFYHCGQWSATYLTGFVGVNLGPLDTHFRMLPELFRINCVWNSPRPNRILKGSWEGIVELDTLPVVDGPASIVIGSSLLLRYNMGTQKDRRFVPYIQWGGGGMYTDAYLHGSPVLSSGFEFILQAGIGAHYFLNRHWALTAEWNYYHFSNGGIVLPNISVNTMGGLFGVTYFFGRR